MTTIVETPVTWERASNQSVSTQCVILPLTARACWLQAQDYRLQYDAIVRIFVLPKSNTPHTLIVISLDPPIRKGQTHYPHILIQFPSDEETSTDLSISDEVFEAKKEAVSPHS